VLYCIWFYSQKPAPGFVYFQYSVPAHNLLMRRTAGFASPQVAVCLSNGRINYCQVYRHVIAEVIYGFLYPYPVNITAAVMPVASIVFLGKKTYQILIT